MSNKNSTYDLGIRQAVPEIGSQTPLVQGDIVTGRVVEVVAQQSIQNASGKWVSLVADGKPYEFGTQTHKTTLFVEPITSFGNDLAAEQRAVVVFGDISGSVAKGHIVQAKVKERNGMLVAQQLNNLTTHSSIQAAAQANGATVLIVGAVLALALAFIAWQAIEFVASGQLITTLIELVRSIIETFGPALAPIAVAFLLIKSFVK